jgi:hypothetical protein
VTAGTAISTMAIVWMNIHCQIAFLMALPQDESEKKQLRHNLRPQ